jgi:hypothetical protein
MLIVDDAYPRWNTRTLASPDGLRFLGLLEELSLGEAGAGTDPVRRRTRPTEAHRVEQGGAPDQSLQDQCRLWMIELKTEAGGRELHITTVVWVILALWEAERLMAAVSYRVTWGLRLPKP